MVIYISFFYFFVIVVLQQLHLTWNSITPIIPIIPIAFNPMGNGLL